MLGFFFLIWFWFSAKVPLVYDNILHFLFITQRFFIVYLYHINIKEFAIFQFSCKHLICNLNNERIWFSLYLPNYKLIKYKFNRLARLSAWSIITFSRCQLLCGRRHQGQPRKLHKDSMKTNLYLCKIKPKELEECAADWLQWYGIVHEASSNFEEAWHSKFTTEWEQWHHVTLALVTTTYFQCSRICTSRFGL